MPAKIVITSSGRRRANQMVSLFLEQVISRDQLVQLIIELAEDSAKSAQQRAAIDDMVAEAQRLKLP